MAKTVRLFSVQRVSVSIERSTPPSLLITVDGLAATPGYSNIHLSTIEKELSPDRIFDLELVGEPPSILVPQVVRPVTSDFVVNDKFVDQVIGVTVHARTNQMTAFIISDPIGPVPWNAHIDPMARPLPTTLALGEEHLPTTWAFGEEHHPTTFVVGEEGQPKTFFIGEEVSPTLIVPGEGHKPFFGETNPQVDDPIPQNLPHLPPGPNPFGQR